MASALGVSLRVQVLGPVRAWHDGQEIELGPAGRRAVLGLLALAGGRVVPRADLVDALWGENPPPSATNVIQTYVKHLRRLFDPQRHRYARSTSIPFVGDGYALRIPNDEVDVDRFHALVSAAGRTSVAEEVAGLLGTALGLWQGRPFADHPGLTTHAKVVALLNERRNALLAHAETMIGLGRAVDLLPLLVEHAADHPLDEAVQALLVRAYAAAGRRADAFTVYDNTLRVLRDELAIGPGAELVGAHAALLDEPVPATSRRADPVPAQLPANTPGFLGRATELAVLDGMLAERDPAATAVIAVCGTAGVGKTALAVHWGHRLRSGFPDGQLYVNLRGYEAGKPLAAAHVLGGFLQALGVAGSAIPVDVDARAARYRTEVADRRLLIVLDNAAAVEQVRLLLPGAPSCVVVVTSRDSLAGLVAVHGARRLELRPLRRGDAIVLLRKLISDRPLAESAAVALAEQCAFLPLPLRVAAELVVSRPETALAELVGELGDRQRRLRLLDGGGDDRAAVREVLSWSYKHLPAEAARLFRLLGVHPGRDFDVACAAALADLAQDTAGRLVDVLVRAHLVDRGPAGRHGMHDLLRAYAVDLAQDEPERTAAFDRLLDHYLTSAAAAMDVVYPTGRVAATAPVADPARMRAWLDAERPNLTDLCAFAAGHDRPEQAMRLAEMLYRYFEAGHHSEALVMHTNGLRAARLVGDREGEARALTNLGAVHRLLGRYSPAAARLRQSLRLHRDHSDRAGEARALSHLGIVEDRLGDVGASIGYLQQALTRYRELGDRHGTASVLTNLGTVQGQTGDHAGAAEALNAGRDLFRALGDRAGEATALTNLADAYTYLGRHTAAAAHLHQALAHFRDLGHRYGEAAALSTLGQVHVHLGRADEAIGLHEEALEIFRATGHRYGEANTLNGLAEALRAADRPGAPAAHREALAIATETGDRDEQSRATAGIASCGEDASTGPRG
ncbi:DNA-binding transcriptional activator of the SARP family [Lentzea waywayandensis]|uniref:DNA-binding transcriptional activator of the SARP family n=1 Tax=Lentzea waywayandensis TaxID=84724 RepID=A0A1I6FDU0_9PSEU|nr:tetratricopeptide repeat protein [Lentzea waywayandensis]SFR28090.1 DNA-binding transcriptional activator of the SARP family [Lentzea waywayandensis]